MPLGSPRLGVLLAMLLDVGLPPSFRHSVSLICGRTLAERSPHRAVPSSQEDAVLDDPKATTESVTRTGETDETEVHAEDVLVEDVSIDGMCGVY